MRSIIIYTLYRLLLGRSSKEGEWVGAYGMLEHEQDAHRILVGKPEGTRLLGDMGVDQWFLNCGL